MRLAIVFSGFLLSFAITEAFSQSYDFIPLGISYQGILKATEGDSVVSDGFHPLRFYLYDDPTDGSLLWQQPPSGQGSQSVETEDGLFNVILGSYGETENDLLREVINDNPNNRWLEIEAYGEILSPRFRLFSTPYAYRSIVADSSREAITSLYADTSFYSWNTNTLGDLDRDGFVEEGEPDVIDGSMIIDGSIMNEDIGFSGFHEVYSVYENDYFSQDGDTWQDIAGLVLEIDIESNSAIVYIDLGIHRVRLPNYTVWVGIKVDDSIVIQGEYQFYYDDGGSPLIHSSVNLRKIVVLDQGPHAIKGQFRGNSPPYQSGIEGKDRTLMAIILK